MDPKKISAFHKRNLTSVEKRHHEAILTFRLAYLVSDYGVKKFTSQQVLEEYKKGYKYVNNINLNLKKIKLILDLIHEYSFLGKKRDEPIDYSFTFYKKIYED